MNKNAAERPNFNYGNEAVRYNTTTSNTYTTIGHETNKKVTKQEQIDRVNKNRQQQFSYGSNITNYRSLTKENFCYKSMDGVALARKEQKLNGLELR